MRLQAAWRRRKARATFSFCLREVCAVKIQLAARRYLLGRKGRNSCTLHWLSNLSLSLSPRPRPKLRPSRALTPWPAAYWALPLTTLVLERLSTSRVSGVHKDKKPQATALLNAKIAISLASLAVLSAALVRAASERVYTRPTCAHMHAHAAWGWEHACTLACTASPGPTPACNGYVTVLARPHPCTLWTATLEPSTLKPKGSP